MKVSQSAPMLLLGTRALAFLAPSPPGPYKVSLTTGELVDWARNDPYAPTPTPRALMVSVLQPTECKSTIAVEDMPEKTAKYQGPFIEHLFHTKVDITPLFLQARLPVCPAQPDECTSVEDVPVLLFSPGYSVPRLYYNVMASAIASEGFVVITIDHPEDANIIIYPDGHAVYNNITTQASPYWDIYPRAADVSFVIDQLRNATAMAELLPHRGAQPFLTDSIGMFGHSCGGAAAVVAAYQDSRIKAAVNWDGELLGDPDLSGFAKPLLLMERGHVHYQNWTAEWPHLDGPKVQMRIHNTTHQSFSDVPTLFQAAGKSLKPYVALLGSIDPPQMVQILTTYTTAWFTGAFQGKEGGLWDGKEAYKFPQVEIVKKANL